MKLRSQGRGRRPALLFQTPVGGVLTASSYGLLCIQLVGNRVLAVPASPQAVLYRPPDGTAFWARKIGDEHRHVVETEFGYTIVRDAVSGQWFHAVKGREGRLAKSTFLPGKTPPGQARIEKHLRPAPWTDTNSLSSLSGAEGTTSAWEDDGGTTTKSSASEAPDSIPGPTIIKNLVILACFSDHTPVFTQGDFNALFNQIGYSTDGACGSVRDYHREASHGRAEIESNVANWVVLPHEEAYYGANDENGNDVRRQEFAVDAIASALVFDRQKIFRHSYEKLHQAYTEPEQKPWVPPRLKDLFQKAWAICGQRKRVAGW